MHTPALFPAIVAIVFLFASTSPCRATAGGGPPPPQRPIFTQQPASASVELGQTATFTVVATGYPLPTFQWLKNGSRIPDATAATLTLTAVQSSDAGTYTVVATNKAGNTTSAAATLTVLRTEIPVITAQPLGVTAREGQTVAFEITALASPGLTYHWRRNGAFLTDATGSRVTLDSIQAADAGDYDVVVTNTRGSVISRAAKLTVLSASGAVATPLATRIVWHPAGVAVRAGEEAALTVDAIGDGLAYQWKKNGRIVSGATHATLAFSRATPADMGFYSVVVTGPDVTLESNAAVLTVSSGGTSRLGNLSTRGLVPADGALTLGFSVRGTGPKQVLARAVGPTLARFGVTGVLADPRLQLIPVGAVAALVENNDWCGTVPLTPFLMATTAAGAFALDAGSKDAAVLAALPPEAGRNYTVRITSPDTSTGGIVLAELYDSDSAGAPVRITGLSTLAFAGAGEHALVPGFTVDGPAPKRLLLRAIGPGLEAFGVGDRLARPRLAVFPSGLNQAVAANDGWTADRALAAAFAAAGAFPLDPDGTDAALVITLPPGGYTVAVSGAGGATGNVLLEIYDLDP